MTLDAAARTAPIDENAPVEELMALPSATERSVELRRQVVSGALLAAALIAAAVGVVIALATDGLLRADLVVLVLVFAESRRRLTHIFAVAGVAIAVAAVPYGGAASHLLLVAVVAVAASAVCAAVLRASQTRPQQVQPAGRFLRALAALLIVSASAAAVQVAHVAYLGASLGVGQDWAHLYLRTFITVGGAVLVAGAVWARPIAVESGRWLARLSLGFIIAALTLAVPYATEAYWADQERLTLQSAADTASTSLNSGVSQALTAFLARAATPPRTPVEDQDGFALVTRPLLDGSTAISAVALLAPEGDGFTMKYEADKLGVTPGLASELGADPADAPVLRRALENQAPALLGIREVADNEGAPVPSVVWVAPQASANGSQTDALSVALSIPVLLREAVSAVGPDAAKMHFDFVQAGKVEPGATPVSLDLGPPAIEGSTGYGSAEALSFGEIPMLLDVHPTDSLGLPLARRTLILVGEVLLGVLALLLFAQAANSRFRIQRRLEERESLLAAAIDAAPGLVMLINPQRGIVMANSTSAEVQSEVVGESLYSAMPFELSTEEHATLERNIDAALAGESSVMECADLGSAQTLRIHEIATTPVPSREGLSAAALVQVLDVTGSRWQAMRDAQSERLEALGAMAGGLAHDFNNLLFIINGYIQLMQADKRIQSEPDLERYVSHAGDAAERGTEIAKSLLSVTRSQPLQASAVSVGTFLQGIVPIARQALGPDATLDLRIEESALDVVVDPGQLSSSVLNLVINARDATGGRGSVLLAARRLIVSEGEFGLTGGEYVAVDVIDDGEGMPPEVEIRAFEPFFTTKPVGQGSGLGLASVYSFARQSGGTAMISSRVGEGTTVSIVIPAVVDAGPRASGSGVGAGSVSRVLVVDDEQSLAGLVAGWISDRGVEVRIASSMDEALSIATEFEPDTLLTDMNIGTDVDGLDVAARITLVVPEITVIFMTGFSDRMQELHDRGMSTLPKPFGRQELYRVLFPSAEESATDRGTEDGRSG